MTNVQGCMDLPINRGAKAKTRHKIDVFQLEVTARLLSASTGFIPFGKVIYQILTFVGSQLGLVLIG